MNFGILVKLEPALLTIMADALKTVSESKKTPNELNKLWYRDFKPRMERLVGMHIIRDNPTLRTSIAYDCAYEVLYGCLTGVALR